MAAAQRDDHIEEHSSFIRTPKQLFTVVILAFAVPVAILVMLAIFATSVTKYDANHPAMTDEAIAQRLKPVGQVNLAEGGAAETAAAPAGAPAAAPSPAPAAAAPTPAPAAAAPTPAPAASAPAAPSAAPAPAPAAGAATAAADGKAIYDKVCMACHATGLAGAPKIGDKAAWAPRLKEGMDTVYAIALKGKGAMPPKGGALQLSDAEVKAAVDFMVSQVK